MMKMTRLAIAALWSLGLLFASAPYSAAIAALAGPSNPTLATTYQILGSNSFTAWQGTNNLGTSDDQYTFANLYPSIGSRTQMLWAYQYNFAIPTGSTIQGIEVAVEKRSDDCSPSGGCIEDHNVCLSNGFANCLGNQAQSGVAWPATDTVVTYGGPTDLWGTTWSPADINAQSRLLHKRL
jgi:hypothetical protein